jgi:hypothetical protein
MTQPAQTQAMQTHVAQTSWSAVRATSLSPTVLHRALLPILCLLFALCARGQAPASFEVAGTVVNLLTGDPVRGATLQLTPHAETTPLAEVRSGDDGSFHFAKVPAGKYQLLAWRRSYTARLYEQHGSFNSAVIVAADQDTSHILFRLPPLATIRGVVTGDNGEPVEGARVQLFRKSSIQAPETKTFRVAVTNTDDTGFYEFANQQPADYLIAVSAQPWFALHAPSNPDQPPNELDVAYPVTYFDSTTEEASATPIRLAAGNHVDANIVLHAVPALHIAVARPQEQVGPVTPAELRQSLFGTQDNSDSDVQMTRNARGETEFYGVAPGHYELTSGEPSHVLQLDAVSNSVVDGSNGVASAPLSGKLETAPGAVYDQIAVLYLLPSDPAQREIVSLISEGKFSLQNLPAGLWTVKVRNGYGHDLQIHSIEVAGKKTGGNTFTSTGQPLELTITATQGAVNVVGFAKKGDRGLAGAMVVLVPKETKDMLALGRRDQADSDGSFVLLNAVAGDYTVIAIEDAWELDWSRPEVIARYLPGGQSVTVPVGASGDLRLSTPIAVQQR